MKKIIITSAFLFLLNMIGLEYKSTALPATSFMSKNPPYPYPEIFGKNIISTDEDEFGATFTPDGNTVYFTKKSPSTLQSAVVVICYSQFVNGTWQEPRVAAFSGQYKDFNPCMSPDGSTLFFISDRPVGDNKKKDADIWFVEKTKDGWSQPKNIGAPINTDGWELGCSVTNDGTLYFSSTRDGKSADIYCSHFVNGTYQQPENLGDAINTPFYETDPFVAPDESYLLFVCTGRDDALTGDGAIYPRGDIYISFKKDGKWTTAKNIGAPVNSGAEESNPFVSADGKTLFYTSEKNFVTMPMDTSFNYDDLENHLHSPANGLGDIYEIEFDKISKQ